MLAAAGLTGATVVGLIIFIVQAMVRDHFEQKRINRERGDD